MATKTSHDKSAQAAHERNMATKTSHDKSAQAAHERNMATKTSHDKTREDSRATRRRRTGGWTGWRLSGRLAV
jgi:hypothetical protein